MRERHHGLKSWDEHGTEGAGQAVNATSRKKAKMRDITHMLFRDARNVSRLTGMSSVTKEVHESDVTSCTARKRTTLAQKPHFSEAIK